MRNIEEQESKEFLPGDSGFTVPDGYFEQLENRILSKLETHNPKVIKLFKREYLFYAAAVAAIFALFLGDFFKSDPVQTMGWDDIEVSAMENYIEEGYEMGYFELNTADYPDFILNQEQLVSEEDFNSVDSDAALDYIDEHAEDPIYILE
ncbi:hypothetical protein [Christiangramia sabulilitoris]|uniref:DUF3379 domain-containing protein n=1 Tax=Christiangramia sabulilitoris TaxID=2583991 RepID=A0A550I6T1_9FLAO|nr:hypothetical protein [Christiangramia sabulilitoris]TRO66680.1 hypothetical protein FGM01_01985 [Christiangramia sabulilitoris]